MKTKKVIIILFTLSLVATSLIGVGVYFLIANKNKSITSDSNKDIENNLPSDDTNNVNNFNISIEQENDDKYYISNQYKFKANIKSNNINSYYKYNWEINGTNSTIIGTNDKNELLCTFNEVGNYTINLKVINQDDIEKTTSLNINVLDLQTININVNNLKNEYNILEENNLSISLTQNINNPYYEWTCNDNDLILRDVNSDNVKFKSSKSKSYNLNISVYKDNSKNQLLSSKTIELDFSKMYDLKISEYDSKLEKYSTNDVIELSNNSKQFLESISNYLPSILNKEYIKNILNRWSDYYLNSFITTRNNTCNGNITEFNINVNDDLSISGNIKFSFKWTNDMNSSLVAASRKTNDIEIHNYVFNKNKIEPYINYSVNNFLSFKIISNSLEKSLTTSVQYADSYNIKFDNKTIYLDNINELSLNLNNSLFNINVNNYINNLYLYQIANDEQKHFIEEVIYKIVTRKINLIIAGNHPIKNITITSPVICIDLDKTYNLDNEFLSEFNYDISPLFYFISNKIRGTIKGNKLYLETSSSLLEYIPKNTSLIDLNTNSIYQKDYRDITNINDIYSDIKLLKETLINNNINNIKTNWLNFLNNLNDTDKANKIYEFMLPFVSYGQLNTTGPSQSQGYIYEKVICEGYANIFNYIANTLDITSMVIIGQVQTGAVPGQTASDGKHAWNLIKNNNTWLWCDPTWDDSMVASSPNYNLDNFLKTSSEFFTPSTHKTIENWDNGNMLPVRI